MSSASARRWSATHAGRWQVRADRGATMQVSGGPPPPLETAGRAACIVIAEFEIRPEASGGFDALARRFAAECLANEPGCRRFDVVQLDTPPHAVLFYEVYEDDAAFEAHCCSPHLARFRAAFRPLIVRELPLRRGWS